MRNSTAERFVMRSTLIALFAVFSIACSGDDLIGSSTVTGNYALFSINGSSLPFTVSGSGANKTEIVDDVISLYEGFTYAEVIHTRVTVDGQVSNVTTNKAGSYALLGNSIAFSVNTGGAPKYATITADVLKMVESGLTSLYRK